ncbi:MAG: phospho-sugar mutase [Polyangiales bacterium]
MNDDEIIAAARRWTDEDPDPVTRAEAQALLERRDLAALRDRFGARLEFGTAGLRGELGAGPNRMNRALVIRATAGLAAHLLATVPDAASRGVVVGWDGRRNSDVFARDVAATLAGAGIVARVLPHLAPTPLVAFAVRQSSAAAGVMVTASHNPPEYNGYKVYWGDGGQITPPVDAGIASAIDAVGALADVPRLEARAAREKGLHVTYGPELEDDYVAEVHAAVPEVRRARLTIAYTPLHGVGERLAARLLARFGEVKSVAEQARPDGAFPTVRFPNPEEPGAMDLVLALAARSRADLAIANDPDADRLCVAVPRSGGWAPLSGNALGVLLGHHLLTAVQTRGPRVVANSIVSSPLLARIAASMGVTHVETLTGFSGSPAAPHEVAREQGARFVFGYEEALGYCVGDIVRDKDGVSAACVAADLASRLKAGEDPRRPARGDLPRARAFVSGQRSVTARRRRSARHRRDDARVPRRPAEGDRRSPGHRVGGLPHGRAARRGGRLDGPASDVVRFDLEGVAGDAPAERDGPKIEFYFDLREAMGPDEALAGRGARAALEALADAFTALVRSRGTLPL